MPAQHVLAIDQGTTSTRCMIFDHDGREVARDQREHRQILPQAGWVEHDAETLAPPESVPVTEMLLAVAATNVVVAASRIARVRDSARCMFNVPRE